MVARLALVVLAAVAGCAPVHDAREVRWLEGAGPPVPKFGNRPVAKPWETVAWSADGARVAAGNQADRVVQVWDVSSGRVVGRMEGDAGEGRAWAAGALAYSRDGGRVAFAAEDGTVRVWDWASGTVKEVVGQPRRVREIVFTPDGERIVTVSGGSAMSERGASARELEPLTVMTF